METIASINHFTSEIIIIRNQIAFFTAKLEELKDKRDTVQRGLMETMKSNNLKSWKTNENSFSLVSKMDTRITNEEEAIQDIKARNLQGLVTEKIDTVRFKQIANILLREKGELFFGTEAITSEYLSIRSLTKDNSIISAL